MLIADKFDRAYQWLLVWIGNGNAPFKWLQAVIFGKEVYLLGILLAFQEKSKWVLLIQPINTNSQLNMLFLNFAKKSSQFM